MSVQNHRNRLRLSHFGQGDIATKTDVNHIQLKSICLSLYARNK